MPSHKRSPILIKEFLYIFLPLSVLVSVVLGLIYQNQLKYEKKQLLETERVKINLPAKIATLNLQIPTSDLIALSHQQELEEIFQNSTQAKKILQDELLGFLKNKNIYDTISLLDETGKEIIRINFASGRASIVPEQQLQSQASKNYFKNTMRLNREEIYVSPFSLNVEKEKIERPLKPIIQFATPIFDDRGQKRGILVLNYLGEKLIEDFERLCSGDRSECMMLNSQGFWLDSPKAEDERGFLFDDRRDRTFVLAFPKVWQKITDTDSGQLETAEGLFTFSTVYPLKKGEKSSISSIDSVKASQDLIEGKSYYWKFVSHIPSRELYAYDEHLPNQLILYLLLLGLIGIGSLVVARDRQQKRSSEQQMRSSEAKFRSLSEASPVGIFQADDRGACIYTNKRWQDMTGFTEAQILGNNWIKAIHPDDRESVLAQWLACIREELEFISEFRLLAVEGDLRWVSSRAVPLLSPEGQISGFVCTNEDITELVTQKFDLEEARQAAEAANRAKSEFLATMSHEIRTPINAVIGLTDLLLDMDLTPQQQEYLATIRNSGDSLLTIINDILDFSKIEAGKLDLEAFSFNLRTCIEESLDLLAARAAEKNLELTYQISPHTPLALIGDLNRLRQILVNLIANAVKFTETGEIVVSVSSHRSKEAKINNHRERVTIQFSVRDTGVGIPPEKMSKLFKPFSQVDASTTREYGGTGLGLAICQRLCQAMGGKMWVESCTGDGEISQIGEPDYELTSIQIDSTGSVFYFTVVTSVDPNPPNQAASTTISSLAGKRILVVDDNFTNLKLLQLQLKYWGAIVQTASSTTEALSLLEQGKPLDLALLDLQMPDKNGIELGVAIHDRADRANLPLVLLTSLNQIEENREAYRTHFVTSIIKPVKQSSLFKTLNGILDKTANLKKVTDNEQKDETSISESTPKNQLRILLAEDNKVNQMVAIRMLERAGYRADVATNGLEVLEILRRQKYDLVLMDVQMPEMDGLEATRSICQEWNEDSRPRIIAMTANAMAGDREICLKAGMDDYISKPIRFQELLKVLENLDCRGAVSAPVDAGTPPLE